VAVVDVLSTAAAVVAVEAAGRRAWSLQADLADRERLRRGLAALLEQLPGLDILVCAAGILTRIPFPQLDDADWDRVLAVNLAAPVVLTQLAWPWLRRSPAAAIVYISSISAVSPRATVGPAYQASKAGLNALVPLVALEGAADGIRANGIMPGPVLTPMIAGSYDPAQRLMATPLGRIGQPDDIASAVAFLVSPDASFITGTVLNVSGGRHWG
jgi:3-oxoacyl-[acyl-carrier protein] reductase